MIIKKKVILMNCGIVEIENVLGEHRFTTPLALELS